MNNKIKEYTTGKGKKRYKFSVYIGRDAVTGTPIQCRRSYKTYEEALKAYNKIIRDIENGTYEASKKQRYCMNDLYGLWLPVYKQGVRESTLINTKNYFKKYILKDMGNIYLDKLTPARCQKTINKWYEKCTYSIFNNLYGYASKMLDYAVSLDLVDKNPMKQTTKPRNKNKKEKEYRIYTVEELNKFLQEARYYSFKKFTLLRLLAYSGMRIGEVIALNWSDIDFNNNTVSVTKTVSKGENKQSVINPPKTKAGYRTISLDDETMEYLAEWKTRQRRDLFKLGFNPLNSKQLVFSSLNNEFLCKDTVRYWNKKIAELAGLEHITLHSFRHTHASILFQAGASMKSVQVRLGHASIKMTMDVYTHVTKNQERETASTFAKIMKM